MKDMFLLGDLIDMATVEQSAIWNPTTSQNEIYASKFVALQPELQTKLFEVLSLYLDTIKQSVTPPAA